MKKIYFTYPKMLVFMVFFLVSCDLALQQQDEIGELDMSTNNLIEESLTSYNDMAYSELPPVRRAESLLNNLSDIYVGFGGYWIDSEGVQHYNNHDEINVVIALVKKDDFKSEKELLMDKFKITLANELKYPGFSAPVINIKTIEVDFSFRTLQYYRDILNPLIHKREDMVESFIDLMNNKFSIGFLENSNGKTEFIELLNKFSIPKEAVSIYETGPIRSTKTTLPEDLKLRSQHTLRDYYRPLKGGLQIQREGSTGFCTFGFNVKLDDNIEMWVTNSHCTNEFSSSPSSTDTYFYQNEDPNDLAGWEYRDFEGYSHPDGYQYRYSDAALIQNIGEPYNFGAIARTNYPEAEWGQDGSIVINTDPSLNHNTIFSDSAILSVNETVHKRGRATGWTYGTVTSVCVDVNVPQQPGWRLFCQIRTTSYAQTGDSGAPLFGKAYIANPPFARLYGIHHGINISLEASYSSHISDVKDELSHGETITTY